MKTIAIIPARGGSKGIPRKNIKKLNGKPLIAYSIEAALNSKNIDKVILSTDDEEISRIGKSYGAEIIKRPLEISGDETPTEHVIEHAINWLETHQNYKSDIILLLQPTSPLRNNTDIDNSLRIFFEDDLDSLLSVTSFDGFIWKSNGKKVFPINYDFKNRPRRQDKENEFLENGAIYIFKTELFKKFKNRLFGKIGIYSMSREFSTEIDNDFEFWICEEIIKRWQNGK